MIRKWLDVRKVPFAPQSEAVTLTGMEYGGITPLGLPEGWPVLIDENVTKRSFLVIGSGIRRSKLAISGEDLVAATRGETLVFTL